MPTLSRAFLITMAVAFAVVVFCLGISFTYSAESAERAQGSEFFWLLLAVAFTSPLWVPALPMRSRWVSATIRWVSAAALLVPLRYAGAVVLHQAHLYPYPLFSASIFAVASTLSVGCVAAIVVLLLPSLPRVPRKAA
jgi:hypothetical protein